MQKHDKHQVDHSESEDFLANAKKLRKKMKKEKKEADHWLDKFLNFFAKILS